MGSPPVSVNLKPVLPRTVKPENTLFSLSPSESNSSSSESTRWTTPSQNTPKIDMKKSSRKSPLTSRKSVTTQKPSLSSQFQDGTETTWLKPPPTCLGTRVGTRKPKKVAKSPVRLSSKLWTPSTSQSDHPTKPSDSHSKTSTRLVVSERCQSAESKPESSKPVWSLNSLHPTSPPKSNPSKCTTPRSQKVFQVTTSDSTSRTSPSKTSDVVTSAQTAKKTQPWSPKPSMPRSSS